MNFMRRSCRTRVEVRSLWLPRRFFLLTVLMMLVLSAHAHAQTGEIETPSIMDSMTPLNQATNDIKSQPLALLAKFPEAGVAMARYVAETILRQPSVIEAILSIVPDATPEQSAAIGAGMARGLRALEARSPGAQKLSNRIMMADNVHFRTTFGALGAGYVENAPFIMPPYLPYPELRYANVGDVLPEDRSRVGPANIGRPSYLFGKHAEKSGDSNMLTRRGMIVAIMASDKDKNGAVSTSPTH